MFSKACLLFKTLFTDQNQPMTDKTIDQTWFRNLFTSRLTSTTVSPQYLMIIFVTGRCYCPCFLLLGNQVCLCVSAALTESGHCQLLSLLGITHCSGNLYNLYFEPSGFPLSFAIWILPLTHSYFCLPFPPMCVSPPILLPWLWSSSMVAVLLPLNASFITEIWSSSHN